MQCKKSTYKYHAVQNVSIQTCSETNKYHATYKFQLSNAALKCCSTTYDKATQNYRAMTHKTREIMTKKINIQLYQGQGESRRCRSKRRENMTK